MTDFYNNLTAFVH